VTCHFAAYFFTLAVLKNHFLHLENEIEIKLKFFLGKIKLKLETLLALLMGMLKCTYVSNMITLS
jgi:hypothetical protein